MNELEQIREKRKRDLLKKIQRSEKMKINVSDQDFQQKVIEESKSRPVIVDFWAGWCMPCRMLGPIIEEIANELDGKVLLAKLDVDSNQLVSRTYGISGIPSVKLFKDGQVVDQFVGLRSKEMILEWLNKHLGDD